MQKICFNKNWQFMNGNLPFNYWGWWRLNEDSKKTVDLPHDFMIEQKRDKDSLTQRDGGYFPGGVGYYSKKFFAPAEWQDKVVFVEFEGIYKNAEIKLNGNKIKRQSYGYTTFIVDLNKYIKYGEENNLEVIVDNSAVPNSRWYSGSGIYRYAWMYVGEKTHISPNGLYVKTDMPINNDFAGINISITIDCPDEEKAIILSYKHIITDLSDNSIVAKCEESVGATNRDIPIIKNPKLWDIDSPNLYKLKTQLYEHDKLIDTAETTFGIRTFTLDTKNGFVLNGRPLKLKGGCVHHDNGILGAASYVRSEERKIEILKQSGYNAVRTAHNPPAPAFLDACDRLGMIVMDEIFDQWRVSKTQYDYHMDFDHDWEHDITSMVLRDRNHPSVIFWSTGNEIAEQCGTSDAPVTSKKLFDAIKKYDNRPVGMALMGYDHSPANIEGIDKVVAPLDFVGYNYIHGDYEPHMTKYPERVIIGTETVPKDIYTTWELTLKCPNVIGDFVWTAIDYLGEAGIGRAYYTEERPEIEQHLCDYPWNQAYCGDIDVCGFKRPQSYYRDILWGVSDKPKMFVRRPVKYSHESEKVTYWGWNDDIEGWDFDIDENKTVVVDIYSPAQSVELFLNGESMGKNDLKELKTSFIIPYKKGELKAIDSNNNVVILSTSKAPAKIKLTADRNNICFDGDLSYVTVEIVDIDGKTVTNAFNTISFAVEGAGKLLAVGSGNPKTEEMYVGNIHSAYDGKLMAVVKSTNKGEIKLTAISNGLEKAEIIISAE